MSATFKVPLLQGSNLQKSYRGLNFVHQDVVACHLLIGNVVRQAIPVERERVTAMMILNALEIFVVDSITARKIILLEIGAQQRIVVCLEELTLAVEGIVPQRASSVLKGMVKAGAMEIASGTLKLRPATFPEVSNS